MNKSLIAELREFRNDLAGHPCLQQILDGILSRSRHEAEQGEGLREAVKDVYEDIMLNEDTEYDDAESVAVKLGEILLDNPPTKAEKGGK